VCMRSALLRLSTVVVIIALAGWFLFPDTLIVRNTDTDEGVYLIVARLLHRGYDTRTFFFDQFWFFPSLLTAAFKLFGDSLIVGRLIVFALAMAGVVAVAALSYQLGANWSAMLASLLICALSPLYTRQARMVMADVPATTFMVWALVFVFLFQKNRRRFWLALAGVCASASLMLKPFTIGFLLTIIIVLLAERTRRENGRFRLDPAIFSDLLVFVTFGALTAAPFIDFLRPIDEYRRTVGFHLAERNWLIKRVDDRWRGLLGFVRLNLPIVVFAITGIVALRPLSISFRALLAGELVTIAILLWMPPWLHHYTLILPPLIIFALVGFDRGFAQFKAWIAEWRRTAPTRSSNKVAAILFGCALVISLIDLPWLFRFERRIRWPRLVHFEPAVAYVKQNFQRDEYLLSDDALVLYLSDRLMPPAAINFMYGDVLKFDPMSFSRFEQVVRDNHVAGIITTTRYPRNQRLMSWIEQNFPRSTEFGTHDPDDLTARIYSADKQRR